MVNFGLLAASLGHPSYFQRLPRLGSVTARQSSSERHPNFAALNRGRHLCSAGRPSRWALAHILVPLKIVPSHGGSEPPSNTWFLWLTRILNPNGISIGLAVLHNTGNVFMQRLQTFLIICHDVLLRLR